MRILTAVAAIVALFAGQSAVAQELDTTTVYIARTTVAAQSGVYKQGAASDNDIFALDSGLTWRDAADPLSGKRFVLRAGVRNEDWTGTYPALGGAELLKFATLGDVMRGYGTRLAYASDRSTTLEAFFAQTRFEEASSLRLMTGIGAVAEPSKVAGRDSLSAYALAEKSWYFYDDLVTRAGVMVDETGLLLTASAELQLFHSPYYFGLEWTQAPWTYRGLDGYNDLRGWVRYVVPVGPNKTSLMARDRYTPLRLGARFADLQ